VVRGSPTPRPQRINRDVSDGAVEPPSRVLLAHHVAVESLKSITKKSADINFRNDLNLEHFEVTVYLFVGGNESWIEVILSYFVLVRPHSHLAMTVSHPELPPSVRVAEGRRQPFGTRCIPPCFSFSN
jgi:hypothetical protein